MQSMSSQLKASDEDASKWMLRAREAESRMHAMERVRLCGLLNQSAIRTTRTVVPLVMDGIGSWTLTSCRNGLFDIQPSMPTLLPVGGLLIACPTGCWIAYVALQSQRP